MIRSLPAAAVLIFSLLLPGCTWLHPAPVPLRTIDFGISDRHYNTLLVLLPGRYDGPERFAAEGFIAEVRRRKLPVELMGVDAGLGYYYQRSLVERLHQDVIAPARQRGFQRVWLAGISLGGWGALWYDRSRPGEVDGVILLAPYLGEESFVAQVSSAGGARTWQPDPGRDRDYQQELWQFVQGYGDPRATAGRVFLGYGQADAFAPANALLAELLPTEQVVTVEGGHDWATWSQLWQRLLSHAGQSLAPELRP
jgi:pimeloyl-ACP methyl ester carboxylesterase